MGIDALLPQEKHTSHVLLWLISVAVNAAVLSLHYNLHYEEFQTNEEFGVSRSRNASQLRNVIDKKTQHIKTKN